MAALGRRKVPPMTQAEKRAAFTQSQAMTGFVAETTEERLFLKCAFSSDDISTVWLDPILAAELFWALKRLLKNPQEIDGAAVKLAAGAKPEFGGWCWAPEN
jgi:hypothetical protein